MKVKPFWCILLVIGVVWISSYVYAQMHKLDHPVFLNHYLDLTVDEQHYIPFYYVTNKEDTSFIQLVELGEIRGFPERFGDTNGVEEVGQFGRYSLRRVMIQFNLDAIVPPVELQRFDKMNVYFSEQSEISTPIGEIIFRPLKDEINPLTFKSGSVSSYSENRFMVDEAVTIESVDTLFEDVLEDQFFVKLQSPKVSGHGPSTFSSTNEEWNQAAGIDVREVKFPIRLEKGDGLIVKSFAESSCYSVFDLSIELTGKTATGESFTGKNGYLGYYPELDKRMIEQLIHERTEAEVHE